MSMLRTPCIFYTASLMHVQFDVTYDYIRSFAQVVILSCQQQQQNFKVTKFWCQNKAVFKMSAITQAAETTEGCCTMTFSCILRRRRRPQCDQQNRVYKFYPTKWFQPFASTIFRVWSFSSLQNFTAFYITKASLALYTMNHKNMPTNVCIQTFSKRKSLFTITGRYTIRI